ncbi:hypothetical protein [Bradyrhizobium valentinum]|uniref:Curlin n=1 Tax=Bradyrhizobium valentinum TaxID=1518501 RepID=A0A0R3M9U9_9BRAD|nr:hypothetical protein [Bradyrhizobium valentinum]KRR03120.1 hypothetical protein CP49_04010 [Bradyrhizobium valentinum]KRR14054.1 hypothetical protein CQ10_09595 [Bradyrhizobium valentinum]
MRLTLKSIAAFAAISILPSSGAFAQSVANPIAPTAALTGGGAAAYTAPRTASLKAVPELAAAASGGNYASTLEIGAYNKVFQAQLGADNVSNVGIIKGYANSVGVLQAGNNLKSNVALINTQGLAVGVIQPNGSAPVNVMIARLPNGGLLIKR